jgi:photosystem II stability/assembly factor-like uncharacterized protein
LVPARLYRLFAAALFVVAVACSQPAADKSGEVVHHPDDQFQLIGPGGGGGMFLPTISPHDPNLAMMHCDMTAAYITHDGTNWELLDFWTVPEDFEFDPVDPEVIYTAVRGYSYSEDRGMGITMLLKSNDRGKYWSIIYPHVDKAIYHGKVQQVDKLPSEIVEGAFDATIEQVEVDPADNRKIYLGMSPLVSYMSRGGEEGQAASAILVSTTDGGATWQKQADLPGRSVLGIFPAALTGRLLVFTDEACIAIDESSGAQEQLPLPSDRIWDATGGVSSGGPLLYVLARMDADGGGGVFRSSDSGKSWTQVNTGLMQGVPEGSVPNIREISACESKAEVVYLSSANSREANGDSTAWLWGIFKTSDAGDNWEGVSLSNGEGYLTQNYTQCWMDDQWGPGWGGNPINLGVSPQNPDLVIGTDAGRAYKSINGGRTWGQIHSQKHADGTFTTRGLNVTTCYGVHFDPFDPQHLFISYTDNGLFTSHDGGKSWSLSLEGIPPRWTNTCYWLEFDPEVQGRIWSVWANSHDLPRDKMFGPGGFGRYQGGVAVTDDGGHTWRKSMEGIPDNSIGTFVLVDPDSPKDARTVYATIFDRGVYKSVDGGVNWTEANNGLGDNLCAWKIRRASDGALYVVLARKRVITREGNMMKMETVGGEVYKSTDKAASWTRVALPAGENAPHDMVIDPADPNRIFLCCWAVAGEGGDVAGGVYRSTDGGASWECVFNETRRPNSIALDPFDAGTIYINTFENAAYRSDNWGSDWKRIKGYRFKWGQRPVPDVNNPGMLYLTTYGGSVMYGPAWGVPDEMPDITNMPENWW